MAGLFSCCCTVSTAGEEADIISPALAIAEKPEVAWSPPAAPLAEQVAVTVLKVPKVDEGDVPPNVEPPAGATANEAPAKADSPAKAAVAEPADAPAPLAAAVATPMGFQEGLYADLKAKLAAFRGREETNFSPGQRRPSTVGVSIDDYVASRAANFQELQMLEPMEGWTFKAEQDGVKIYVKQDCGGVFFKAIGLVKTNGGGLPKILNGLMSVEERPKWDETISECRSIAVQQPFYRVTLARVKSPSPLISPREVLLLSRFRFEEDGKTLCIALSSTELAEVPETPNYVRAVMQQGGYIIRPTEDPDVFWMMWAGAVDPRGWIPGWASNLVAWKQGLTLARFRKALMS